MRNRYAADRLDVGFFAGGKEVAGPCLRWGAEIVTVFFFLFTYSVFCMLASTGTQFNETLDFFPFFRIETIRIPLLRLYFSHHLQRGFHAAIKIRSSIVQVAPYEWA